MSHRTAWFWPRLRGGGGARFRLKVGIATFLYLSHSAVFIPCESFPPCRTGKKEGDESDPPKKRGGMRSRIAGVWGTPLSGPMLVALVLIYPCGKAQKSTPEGR